ncbi:proton myo-inositol cotransporter [Fomitiporia mediterranea MF3/22]|uniref:proton myo-inositol cotransporter n=1 Tax=Fomitiporia mediterranea (strain MF3/22) TaxID=694068 RepID=UPI0004408F54|nr:proton myo-inositol cotransporter [Fomitiporia mediterranea MF3/22]EJD03083.1 proton myo-inositol cotransporter [Fomitiporia mediterranea MF3/22]
MASYNEKELEKPTESYADSVPSNDEKRTSKAGVDPAIENINAKLANPLAGIPQDQLMRDGALFARQHGLTDLETEFAKGALIAQDPLAFETLDVLTEDDKAVLRNEQHSRWDQPLTLYWLVVMCSICAAVQGMDETVINGAQIFYAPQFGIGPDQGDPSRNEWLVGLVNSAPYLCCAVLGCWITDPLNKLFGRRGTIFITATFSFLTCIWQGVTNSWEHLFVARFILGLGIGPKSTTVPVYAAECAPTPIRGALVMMWQMWTAFGIMLGFVSDLIFLNVRNTRHITGLNWRLMLASAGVPALFVMAQVWFCPESPRWLLGRGRYADAYRSLARLRKDPLLAARDLYYIHVQLEAEESLQRGHRFLELFSVPRNRRAALASFIVMFMQQFCGVNAIAYYSTQVFLQAGFTTQAAFLASFGFGTINWLFALPAVKTIDTFGRRNLLLTTFPLMSLCLLLTGFAFFIPESNKAHIGIVALGIYLFGMVYSPGEGPVPFTYSAEAFPLYVRDIGMSFATATTWFFNFVVSITFPRLLGAFTPQGAFGWYAGWNLIGFVLILLFVPETKALSLEELDQVFSVSTRKHASYQLKALPRNIKKYIFRMKVEEVEPLYQYEGEKTFAPTAAAA